MLTAPPVLHALQSLRDGLTDDLVERFLSVPEAHRELTRRIEFRPNYICFPVRTPTRPPATHTNCYLIYNSQRLLIIDAGSPYEDEQQALATIVDELLSAGRTLIGIVLTHLHPDHVGGVNVLRSHLGTAKVLGHEATAAALSDIQVDEMLEDLAVIHLDGEPQIDLQVLHTPGHARGHLCLYERRTGTLISGDNIVGLGSVLIDPPEGNMRHYLMSLERMRSLENLSVMFGGHGPAIANPYRKIDEYISHRLERERNILTAIAAGAGSAEEVVARVYTDVSPKAHAMAERAVLAHVEKLVLDNLVERRDDGRFSLRR